LIGPITVGDGTKIMAGAVLTRSVPPNSLVKPAEAEVTVRGRAPARKAGSQAG
jgi:serine acetyltransferase